MKHRKDSTLEALRRANPATEESTAGWHLSAQGKEVAARTRAETPERPAAPGRREDPRRRRRHRAAIVLIAAAAAFGIAAAFAIGSRGTLTPDTATCHAELLQRPGGVLVGLLGRDPVEACTEEWEESFGEPAPRLLAACVIHEGATGVFPYPEGWSPDEACASIDAAPFEPEPDAP